MALQTNEHVVSGSCLAAHTELPIKPRRESPSSGALLCADKPGPLATRIKKKPAAEPTPSKKHKPNRPTVKRLRLFSGFDDRGFHPTLELAWSQTGLCQLWRHRNTDEPEWRLMPTLTTEPITVAANSQPGPVNHRALSQASSATPQADSPVVGTDRHDVLCHIPDSVNGVSSRGLPDHPLPAVCQQTSRIPTDPAGPGRNAPADATCP